MLSRALLLALPISSLLLVHAVLASASASKGGTDADLVDDDDLSFLGDDDDETAESHDGGLPQPNESYSHGDDQDQDQDDAFDNHHDAAPEIDETDVVVLAGGNFSEFLGRHRHLMMQFYVPWCKICQAFAPEYAAVATALRGEDVVLAKVDVTAEAELAQKYDVQDYPTVVFLIDGVHKYYFGQKNRDAIVSWIKKKIGRGVQTITTTEEAEKILTSESKVVLGFLDSLVGAKSRELSAASELEDDVNFYQTVNPDVAKLFHIDAKAKRPSLVLLKDAEKITYYDGRFTKSAIAAFVFANKLPLVITFTRETASDIFESSIKKQLFLFAISNDAKKVMPAFEEAAKFFKGKLFFVYVELDNDDFGKPVSAYFGVNGDGPQVLAYTGHEDAKKFVLDGGLTLDNIKKFAEDFLADKLKPYYKSDPIPETNDGDVKIVVGKNFDKIVLDKSKDVLLMIYAPWCEHCQEMEAAYNKLAKHLRGVESVVIAKMEGTANEHPRAKVDGFPTILFFPAGKKSSGPIIMDTERTVKEFYKFIKKHAAISFKLQSPSEAPYVERAYMKEEL